MSLESLLDNLDLENLLAPERMTIGMQSLSENRLDLFSAPVVNAVDTAEPEEPVCIPRIEVIEPQEDPFAALDEMICQEAEDYRSRWKREEKERRLEEDRLEAERRAERARAEEEFLDWVEEEEKEEQRRYEEQLEEDEARHEREMLWYYG